MTDIKLVINEIEREMEAMRIIINEDGTADVLVKPAERSSVILHFPRDLVLQT